MQEILKALVELATNQNAIMKAQVKIMEDLEEVKAGINFLTGNQNEK